MSQELIDHLSKFFEGDLQKQTVADYIIFCTACAKANYTPPNWESTILKALKTFKFGIYLTRNFDWAEFVLNLDKLGYRDTQLLRKIINSKYLQSHHCYDENKAKKLKNILKREDGSSSDFVEESESDSSDSDSSDSEDATTDRTASLSLHRDLLNMFGVGKIWPNVRVDQKLTIPYMLKMDLSTGDFLLYSEKPSVRYVGDNELL